MNKLLLITPPFLQPNCPYPATAYLKGYLKNRGFPVEQADLSIELLNRLFSRKFLEKVFDAYTPTQDNNLERIYALRGQYIESIDTVMEYLRGEDTTLATLICNGSFLPQAARFDAMGELGEYFGVLGINDCARFLCTLYLQEVSDMIRITVTPYFEIVRYGASISVALERFDSIEKELNQPPNLLEQEMIELLEGYVQTYRPSIVGFTVPFPGNLLCTLRCAAYLQERHPAIQIAMGGGYPSTELRQMSDRQIFKYVDYIVLDDGEAALEQILRGETPAGTWRLLDGEPHYEEGKNNPITHTQRGCPDFEGLPHKSYFSLLEVVNPMHRLWSEGRWNKIAISHGCYWAKCAFCDTSLDYIARYEGVPAIQIVDTMEQVISVTGSRGFHFVDEAASPKALKEISLEILRRKLKVSWWGNIRFESGFTGDLAQLMASAGCIALSGGLETASDRLLGVMNKGVTIEQATLAMRNFYYAGIMVHTYLMYGFPTQTLQESVDSLEVVRQLFRAELIHSAFWHRFALTLHSPCGQNPEIFGLKLPEKPLNSFANNELRFREDRGYSLDMVGEALNEALKNYLFNSGINRPAHKWFRSKGTPITSIENSLITDQLIKPDASRIYDDLARLVWIGAPPIRTEEGLLLRSHQQDRSLKFKGNEVDYLLHIMEEAADLSHQMTLSQARTIYSTYSEEPFLVFYHSKKWDILRKFGLLQI